MKRREKKEEERIRKKLHKETKHESAKYSGVQYPLSIEMPSKHNIQKHLRAAPLFVTISKLNRVALWTAKLEKKAKNSIEHGNF